MSDSGATLNSEFSESSGFENNQNKTINVVISKNSVVNNCFKVHISNIVYLLLFLMNFIALVLLIILFKM